MDSKILRYLLHTFSHLNEKLVWGKRRGVARKERCEFPRFREVCRLKQAPPLSRYPARQLPEISRGDRGVSLIPIPSPSHYVLPLRTVMPKGPYLIYYKQELRSSYNLCSRPPWPRNLLYEELCLETRANNPKDINEILLHRFSETWINLLSNNSRFQLNMSTLASVFSFFFFFFLNHFDKFIPVKMTFCYWR